MRPAGEPGVIEGRIEVERTVDSAKVVSVDRVARTIALSARGTPLPVYQVGRRVRNWDDIRIGDQVRATIDEVVTIYISPASRSSDPRVRVVDPSYRLLTLQYPDGTTETFKIGLHTRMAGIEAGDSVAMRPVAAVELRVRRHAASAR